jgi:uroporphyrinogen-III decarboxylase
MTEEMTALERIVMVLEGEIPDRIPSSCLGADYDFIDAFMKSPFALTDEDMMHLDKDKIPYTRPFSLPILAKFSPPELFKGGLDAKIDLCWQFVVRNPPIKLEWSGEFITENGMILKTYIRENGLPHNWFMGPALVKKEYVEAYWEKEKELRPTQSVVQNFSRIRKTMLKKYDIVVAQGLSGPFENLILGIGLGNFARWARKEPTFLQQHIDFQWETFEKSTLEMLLKTKPEIVMCGDDYGFNSGLQLPIKDWHRFIKPTLEKFIKITHERGAKFILHTCGDIHEIFSDIVEMRVDGVHSLQPQINDLKTYRKKHPKFPLIGTIDDAETLKFQSPENIRTSVRDSIKLLGKKGGYIPGPTNYLLDQPPDNVITLFKSIQEFGRY